MSFFRLIVAGLLVPLASHLVAAPADSSELLDTVNAMRAQHVPTGPLVPTTEQLIAPADLAGHKTATLLILHINDVHDILLAPAKDLGGLAYVAGYANALRAKRPDVLFADAGDICRKGDVMGPASKGAASYLALASIGLDVTVPGNNDFVYGLDQLVANVRLSHIPILCAGMEYQDDQRSVFPQTMIKRINGLRVGLIGATVPFSSRGSRPYRKFDPAALGQRINALALELQPAVDLTVLVIHNGTAASLKLAKLAPSLNVIVCGHTNEITPKPIKAESGALIVTVGRAGQWVGTLDLLVDVDRKKVARYTYQMVAMDHTTIAPDAKVAQLVADLDHKWNPDHRPTPKWTPPRGADQ
jgi:2',3'-cyclic-nucleotide 2'-phosphodiesterase (5'-nucleotidase family)